MNFFIRLSVVIVGLSTLISAADLASFTYSVVDQNQISGSESSSEGTVLSRFGFELYQESTTVQSIGGAETEGDINILVPELNNDDTAAPSSSDVFNFPNPFKVKSGTTIGYTLSKDMDIELRVYNIFGHLIYQESFQADTNGGLGAPDYNRIEFNDDIINGRYVPSGVYFFILVHQGDIIGKGKMAILP